ncbi:MAG: HNH endonuclease [Rubrobacter sp.]|jgi:5-methylcytosine-specific restriction endonuclease McrA|nr:HNH endonuclease [Rubrobacter sp.]
MSCKICKGCGEQKVLGDFYRHPQMRDGYLNYCKECKKAEIKANRTLKKEHYAEYERQRNQTEKRKDFLYSNLKRWRQKYPEKLAVQLARRRTRKFLAEGDFTVEEFRVLCGEYGNVCLRCGQTDVSLTPDHVIPLSLGGGNGIGNIQPLCVKCDCWKNIKTVDYRTAI